LRKKENGMNRMASFVGLTLFAGALACGGCGDAKSQQELEVSETLVATALDAWKRGDAPASLQTLPTPIEFHDDDWQKEARLVDYEITQVYHDTDGSPRCAVTLTIQRGKNVPEQINETYQVITNPKVIIGRDPMS
jgi:hypothetical protein